MAFNIFRVVHPSSPSNSRTFPPPKEAPYPLAVILYPPSHPRQPLIYFLSLWICPFWTCPTNRIIQYVIFFTGLFDLAL